MSTLTEANEQISKLINQEVETRVKKIIESWHGKPARELMEVLETRITQLQESVDDQTKINTYLRFKMEARLRDEQVPRLITVEFENGSKVYFSKEESASATKLSGASKCEPQNDFMDRHQRAFHSCL